MTTPTTQADRLVLCCRALAAADPGATASNLRDALKTLRPHTGNAALDEAGEPLLRDLVNEGLLEPEGRRYVLADAERERLGNDLGVPRGTVPKWTQLRDVQLLARALGLPAPDAPQAKRLKSAAGCRAAVLATAHGLNLPPYPTSKEVLDALTWNRLEELSGSPVGDWRQHSPGTGKVVSFLLLDPLGVKTPKTASQLLAVLAATAVDAVGPGLPALRSAVLQRWRAQGSLREASNATKGEREAPATAPAATAPDDLIAALGEIVRTEPLGDRADRAVWITALYEATRRRSPALAGDLQSFKTRLLDAARAGRLRLLRADLIDSMDPAEVERSEIRDLHARFHLVILEDSAR